MKDFFEKHYKFMVLILLSLMIGISGAGAVGKVVAPGVSNVTEEVMKVLVSDIIDSAIEPMASDLAMLLEERDNQPDPYIDILEKGLNRFRTTEEVDQMVTKWQEDCWDIQLSAMDYIDQNPAAREELKSLILDEDIYLAFMRYVIE